MSMQRSLGLAEALVQSPAPDAPQAGVLCRRTALKTPNPYPT